MSKLFRPLDDRDKSDYAARQKIARETLERKLELEKIKTMDAQIAKRKLELVRKVQAIDQTEMEMELGYYRSAEKRASEARAESVNTVFCWSVGLALGPIVGLAGLLILIIVLGMIASVFGS